MSIRFRLVWLGFGVVAVAGFGCGDSDGSGGGGSGVSGSTGSASETCEATFSFLQKDAYKETAGRSGALWPPHTTTQLVIQCTGSEGTAVVDTAFQANHGTEPGELDANGDVFLVETKTLALSGTRSELLGLADAYRACSCEAATQFLSLDSLGEQTTTDLLNTLASYLSQNLTCSGMTDTQGLIMLLQQGDIEAALAVLPNCTWAGGTDLEEGLSQALQELLVAVGETLSGYHVCNNDALLQSGLITAFISSGQVGACDAQSDICKGPLWFYEP